MDGMEDGFSLSTLDGMKEGFSLGTMDGIKDEVCMDDLMQDGIVVGAWLVSDALGRHDRLMKGATDDASFGYSIGSKVSMKDGTQITTDGASLGVIVDCALGRDDGSMEGATDGASVEYIIGSEVGIDDGMQDRTAVSAFDGE